MPIACSWDSQTGGIIWDNQETEWDLYCCGVFWGSVASIIDGWISDVPTTTGWTADLPPANIWTPDTPVNPCL